MTLTPETLARLREKHTPPEVPACRVCGAELIYLYRLPGGRVRYSCKTRRHDCDSAWEAAAPPRGYDPAVLALVEAYTAQQARLTALEAENTRLLSIAAAALDLMQSGYDGPCIGDEIAPLFEAVIAWEALEEKG